MSTISDIDSIFENLLPVFICHGCIRCSFRTQSYFPGLLEDYIPSVDSIALLLIFATLRILLIRCLPEKTSIVALTTGKHGKASD